MKYDLHVHSKEVSPCGQMSIEEMTDAYKKKGYSGFWLTNHFHREFLELTEGLTWKERIDFYLSPLRRGREYAGKELFIVLVMEIRFLSDPNDYLLIGIDEKMLYEESHMWLEMDLKSFYESYKYRLLIIQAHPNREDGSQPADTRYLHGLEALNTSPSHNNNNGRTQHMLCVEPRLIPTAGSDSHRPEDVGRSGILTEKEIRGNDDLKELLKRRDYRLIDHEADML